MRFDIYFSVLHPCLENLTGKADDFLSPFPPPPVRVNNANTGTLATSSFSFGWCSAITASLRICYSNNSGISMIDEIFECNKKKNF